MAENVYLMVVLSLYLTTVASDGSIKSRTINDISNPVINPELCGRAKSSYVCDPDSVLTSTQDDALDRTVADIQNNTVCPCSRDFACRTQPHGYIIGLALIKKIQLSSGDAGSGPSLGDSNYQHAMLLNELLKTAKHLSHELLLKWNLGHCKDGILVLYSAADNLLYTAVDSESRRILSDDLVGEISSNVRMELSKNVTAGLETLLHSYKSVFLGRYKRTTNWDNMADALPVVAAAPTLYTSTALITLMLCLVASASL